jgi:hypothetical protein
VQGLNLLLTRLDIELAGHQLLNNVVDRFLSPEIDVTRLDAQNVCARRERVLVAKARKDGRGRRIKGGVYLQSLGKRGDRFFESMRWQSAAMQTTRDVEQQLLRAVRRGRR